MGYYLLTKGQYYLLLQIKDNQEAKNQVLNNDEY